MQPNQSAQPDALTRGWLQPLAMTKTILDRLCSWYQSQCDGQWEHEWGVEIGTVDNPGWRVKINLQGTDLESSTFEEYEDKYDHESSWLRCWKEGGAFHAACGPSRLEDALSVFLSWAEA